MSHLTSTAQPFPKDAKSAPKGGYLTYILPTHRPNGNLIIAQFYIVLHTIIKQNTITKTKTKTPPSLKMPIMSMMSMMPITPMMPKQAVLMFVLVLLAISLLLDAAAAAIGGEDSTITITTMNKGFDVTDGKKPVPPIVTFPMKEYVSFSKSFRCRHELMEVGKGHSPSCLVRDDKCGRRVIDG